MDTRGTNCDALEAASDELPPAVLVCGPDATISYANATAEKLFAVQAGALAGALLSARGWRVASGEDAAPAPGECPISRAIAGKEPVEGSLAEIAIGSAPKKVRVCAYPELDAAGDVRQVIVTLTPARGGPEESADKRSVDEQAHLRLLQSLDHVHKAMRESTKPEAMMRDALDALLGIFDCNRAFLIYPCDPDAPFWEVLMERTRPGVPSAFALGQATPMNEEMASPMRALRRSTGPLPFEVARPPGQASTVELSEQPRTLGNPPAQSLLAMALQPKFGQPWMFGLHRDAGSPPWSPWETKLFQEIGRRFTDSLIGLLAYHGLRDSERKYREVFDNVSDSLVLFAVGDDGKLRVSDVNPAAEKIIGFKRRDILGKSIDEIATPEAAARTSGLLRQVIETGEPITYDEQMPAESGARILSTTLLPVRNEMRSVYRLIVISRDITGRKLAEDQINTLNQELSQRVEALEKANRELENISYSVSHNMKIPLRAIDGFSCLILEECAEQLGGAGQRYLEVIRQSAARLTALIDGLLDFIKLFSQPMHMGRVDMTGLARECFKARSAKAPERQARLKMTQLPPAKGDRAMIRQVLDHLVDNAFKFTARRPEALIEIGGVAQDKTNRYFIRDNGAGFDMRYTDNLFGVFFRLHSQEEFEGSGAGLAIVKRIIERHGGKVWAEGTVGEGATVHFTLPAASAANAEAAA